ncbi:MAG: hypothetical protein KDD51_02025 [Bdellovibrionales bacterium]|nr:hypothetical protein [Bdellovibrionales bacterium]
MSILLIAGARAHASTVMLVTSSQKMIAISNGDDRSWAVNENFCIIQDEDEVACGKVVKTKDRAAFGRIDSRKSQIKKGSLVEFRETPTASEEQRFFIRTEANPHEWFNLADLTISSHWQGLGLNIQQSILPNFSMSIMPTLIFRQRTALGQLDGFAIYLGLNYYGSYLYSGFWAQVGAGLSLYRGNVGASTERKTSPIAHTTLGWRWRFGSGFNFALAGGVQWFLFNQLDTLDLGFSGVLPVAIADIGWVF